MITTSELAKKIQYTNVRADATRDEIVRHCELAAEFGFHAVMLQPCWVPLARELLKGSLVRIATAICYPMGGETTEMKTTMARMVMDLGADEFDFQPNIGYLKSGMFEEFSREIIKVVIHAGGRPVKLMSEFGFLTMEERRLCVILGEKAGVAYIKNSSGVGPGGSAATVEDIRLIKSYITGKTKVKASGQIRSYDQAIALIEAGADLLGTSAGPEIITGIEVKRSAY